VLLGNPQLRWREAFEEVARRVEEFVSHLDGVERAYVVDRLYPRLATGYASLGNFGKAVGFTEEALEATKKLQNAYKEDKASTEEKLRPYLEPRWAKPDLERMSNMLDPLFYRNIAVVYMGADELDKAVECAEKACELAKKLGKVYYEISSCGLLPRLKAVRDGVPPIEEFKEKWQRVLQAGTLVDTQTVATALGEYVVALVSVGHLGELEKVLEEWGQDLKPYPPCRLLPTVSFPSSTSVT